MTRHGRNNMEGQIVGDRVEELERENEELQKQGRQTRTSRRSGWHLYLRD